MPNQNPKKRRLVKGVDYDGWVWVMPNRTAQHFAERRSDLPPKPCKGAVAARCQRHVMIVEVKP